MGPVVDLPNKGSHQGKGWGIACRYFRMPVLKLWGGGTQAQIILPLRIFLNVEIHDAQHRQCKQQPETKKTIMSPKFSVRSSENPLPTNSAQTSRCASFWQMMSNDSLFDLQRFGIIF